MRLYYLLILLLGVRLTGAPARAQSSAAAARPIAAAAPAPPDTAAALHRYFARRRHNGHTGLAVGGVLVAVGGATAAVAAHGSGEQALAPFAGGVLAAVIGLPILARGIVLTLAHSQGREQRVLRAWQQHRLPRRWARRALVPQYTQPAK